MHHLAYRILSLLFFVTLAGAAQAQNIVNLALNQPATASSFQDAAAYPAEAVTDGKLNTRWSSQFKHDPEWIYVDLGSVISFDRVKLNWENAYAKDYLLQISNNATNWTTIRSITGNTELVNDFSALHAMARYVRVYGTARSQELYGYSLFEIGVYNVSNLAFGKPGTASSTLGGNTTANAFDEKDNTRWESTHGVDPGWLYVDLGQDYTINEIKLTWETAAGKDFLVQVSNDATTWTTVRKVVGNTSLVNDYAGLSVQGRYVRMYGTARTTQYGYSLYEFAVYGAGTGTPLVPLPVTLTSFTATAGTSGVQLRWATASEKDNQGFQLQRSLDGTAFERIAYQRGAGTSTSARSYQYLDANAPSGLVYYRLLQTDTDGTTTYSPVVATQTLRQEAVEAITYSLYPNPTTEEARLAWATTAPAAAVVHVYDAQGHAVTQRTLTEEYGQNNLVVDLRSYPTGIYFLVLRKANGVAYQTRVVKQ
ncbi:discoidin domain-containing protein [Hymenobacter aerilatus]|uniref:Discoidin domain-containing protein n=1 Tax=Hymenobacter aerilatus TaxID=2932251 RepID=A0A8T9T1I6_9BACT|nr:discoidin domain-containing protein [Hymenobacter aerilatus]UOR05946.1 discoidin domain-containing protein [Hymenobacter aerilatus]